MKFRHGEGSIWINRNRWKDVNENTYKKNHQLYIYIYTYRHS